MELNNLWTNVPLDTKSILELEKSFGTNLSHLEFQVEKSLEKIKSIHYRSDTQESPLVLSKISTEHWVDRASKKLLICIGESFTWSEGLYGIASGASPPIVNPIIQILFTIHGRISDRFNTDLRTVTYPGNSNSLMISALDRILDEISNLNRWNEIIVLQQFTDRSRCDLGHPMTQWYSKLYHEQLKSIDKSTLEFYQKQEFLLLERLDLVLNKYNHLPLKTIAWRNFNPWIVKSNFSTFNQLELSLNEFKYLLLGEDIPEHPVNLAPNFYLNLLNSISNEKSLDWLTKQLELAEKFQFWVYSNEYGGHPNQDLTLLWAEYLIRKGVNFNAET